MPVKTDAREYRKYGTWGIEERNAEEKTYRVAGYATVFNAPYELYRGKDYVLMEQIAKCAFDNTDMSDVIMQYDHEGMVLARVSNGSLKVNPDGHGLYVEAGLGLIEESRGLYKAIEEGLIKDMSFGFVVDEDMYAQEETDGGVTVETRTITSIRKLYDVSAVSIPANGATEISVRGLVDGAIARCEAERLRALRSAEGRRKLEIRLRLMEVKK